MRSFTTIPALTLLAGLAATGCVDDSSDGGIFITKNVAPGEGCTFTSSEDEEFLPHGVWSVYSPSGYQFFPQMRSRISATPLQVDQRTIIVQGARVDIQFADKDLASALDLDALASAGITKFQTRFSAPLAPNGGIVDVAFDLLPVELIDAIAAVRPDARSSTVEFQTEILATVVIFGDMAGSEVTSQSFTYPVTLCNNCVLNNAGMCPLAAGTAVSSGNACNPYQDGRLDCCEAAGGLTCPAEVAEPMQ